VKEDVANFFKINYLESCDEKPETSAMILVVGPTPALQRRMTFSRVVLGEVNRAVAVEDLASGKGINCARAIQRLGEPVTLLLFTGGENGRILKTSLEKDEISFKTVETQSSSRACCTLIENESKTATELIENAQPVTGSEVEQYLSEFHSLISKAKVLVCIGTLPSGVPDHLYSEMIQKAHQLKIPTIVDAQGAVLLKAAEAKACILKINRKELSEALQMDCSSEKGLFEAMKKLHAKGPLWVVVTDQGKDVYFTNGQHVQKIKPPELAMNNPIGSGDAMTAGFAVASIRETDPMKVLKFAVAVGSANAASEGYGRIDSNLVMQLFAN
jgi:tagatose 6-phosphate kinase